MMLMVRVELILLLAGVILLYILFHRREHLEARYYACSQVCDLSHPGLMNTCQERGGVSKALSGVTKSSTECDEYYDCVKECRDEQREEIASDPNFNVGSKYAHL